MRQIIKERLNKALADRYHIAEEIGSGGMATVYLAEDLKHDRHVALKVMRPELAAQVGVRRFLREIQIAAKLNHPNILTLIDSGDADGLLYYVMPYVEGESLRERLQREHALPFDEALRVTLEIADGLSYAHKLGVIHRDIKPANILISRGHAIVVDFGIAQAVSAAAQTETLTKTGATPGSPLYMSPEQATSRANLDGRSDLYSLACVLFETLSGEHPFAGQRVQTSGDEQAIDPALGMGTLPDSVPDSVGVAIRRALSIDPANRFPTVTAFAAALTADGGNSEVLELDGSGVTAETGTAAASPLPQDSRGLAAIGKRLRIRLLLVAIASLATAVLAFMGLPALRSLLGVDSAQSYPDVPQRLAWALWANPIDVPIFVAAESLLVMQVFDSLYAFDEGRWRSLSVPEDVHLERPLGKTLDGKLLGSEARPGGGPNQQRDVPALHRLLEVMPTGLRKADTIPSPPLRDLRWWWSDGQELVEYERSIVRLTPQGWSQESTGTAGLIRSMWGQDVSQRFAIPISVLDSILVFDGTSWELVNIRPEASKGTAHYISGTSFDDGGAVVVGYTCEDVCSPMILQQDTPRGPWNEVVIEQGRGIPLQRDTSACLRMDLRGATGRAGSDYYVWGGWGSCTKRSERVSLLCPAEHPCTWFVSNGAMRPVVELVGRSVLRMTVVNGVYYALAHDGTLWKRVDARWRMMSGLPRRRSLLAAALPLAFYSVALPDDGGVPTLHLRTATTSSSLPLASGNVATNAYILSSHPLPSAITSSRRLVQLEARDSIVAILTAEGAAFVTSCGLRERLMLPAGFVASMAECSRWDSVPSPDRLNHIALLRDGGVLGVGANGLAASWIGGHLVIETVPAEARMDSLWGVVSEDGRATAIGAHMALTRDSAGRWSVARRIPQWLVGEGAFAVARNGDLVTAQLGTSKIPGAILVWGPSTERGDSLPVAVLNASGAGRPNSNVAALHLLPDGRLVAGFGLANEPIVGSWMQIWRPPIRDDYSERVELPGTIDITDLDDDGDYLYVAGGMGTYRIALDSLPFAERIRSR